MQKNTRKRTTKKTNYTKRALRLRKEFFLSVFLIIGAIFLIIKFHSSPTRYKVVVYDENNTMEIVQYYTDFKVAKQEMQMLIDTGAFNPAILNDEDTLLSMRYGVVNFKTKTCGENTSYLIEDNKKQGYTNGCYGADGAYLETDDKAEKVRFKLSGAVGWVSMSDIELYNYYDKTTVASINHYAIEENEIIHNGTTDLSKLNYPINLSIGENTISLAEGTYYSYDGHYFYDSYPKMIDDYRKNTYANSTNQNPYFNYYQYLSHRSKTSYVSKEVNWYIERYLGFTASPTGFPAKTNESQLYDQGYTLVDTQNTYGVNALMVLSLAINESGMGKSQIAIEKNNLFGHAAYDNAPNENANGYKDVASSIKTHASIFLNKGYLNPCDQAEEGTAPIPSSCLTIENNRYAGSYLGDKGSGLNVNYASDPYWGEKAAQYYRTMDSVLGGKDKDRYTIKVLKEKNKEAYALPSSNSNSLFITPSNPYYAVIVIDEIEGDEIDGNTTWYKIQSDAVLNEARSKIDIDPEKYNAKKDIVYMPAAWFY